MYVGEGEPEIRSLNSMLRQELEVGIDVDWRYDGVQEVADV